jgi:hypothetical protein
VPFVGHTALSLCRSVRRAGHIDRGKFCLRHYKAIWALLDQAWMPSPLSGVQRLDAVTGPFAYVRLLGDREAVDALTWRLDHIVIDRGDQVAADAQAIRLLWQRVLVVGFVNNHFAGYAPETVRQLVALTHAEAETRDER